VTTTICLLFDVSDPTHPEALTFVPTLCGSHTATGVPDLANNRLLVYSSPSSGAPGCRGIDIVEVPLDDPGAASHLRFLPSGDPSTPTVTIAPPSSAAGTYNSLSARSLWLSRRLRSRGSVAAGGDVEQVEDCPL
jgi:hypothetical protein